MSQKYASIYERRGSLFIRGESRTEAGLSIEDGPCVKLPTAAAAAVIGSTVRETLSHSGTVVPHPTEWPSIEVDNPILQAAGIKRWRVFRHGARYLSVSLDGAGFALEPTQNEGRDGFAYLPDHALHLPGTASAEELGHAVKEALERCK